MTLPVRVFTADMHIGLSRNLRSLRVPGYELELEDACLSLHWPLAYDRDPTAGWALLAALRHHLTHGRYDYRRYQHIARAMALRYGWHFHRRVDFTYVSFLPHLVHLYRYLDTPILLHASFRLGGNTPSPDFGRLLDLIVKMHGAGRLFVAATNAYDQQYIKYFTGIDCEVITVDCADYDHLRWNPLPGRPFLAGPLRLSEGGARIAERLRAAAGPLPGFRDLYPGRIPDLQARLCEHPGIVMLPYSVHCITITECMRSGIPLFLPSHRLLTEWHQEYHLLPERKTCVERATVTYPFTPPGAATMPAPDDDHDLPASAWWLRFCDWYDWPVVFFDSIPELAERLQVTDRQEVSARMMRHNEAERQANAVKWQGLIARMLAR